MNIRIINSNWRNTVAINLDTLEVSQIVRFDSGNFYKQTWLSSSLIEAEKWASWLATS